MAGKGVTDKAVRSRKPHTKSRDSMMGRVQVAVLGIAISWIALLVIEVAAADQCPSSTKCSCSFADEESADFVGGGSDSRSVGLAAATGALSSMVLAGGGVALWKFLKKRGGGEINDMYGRPPSSQGSWMDERKEPSSNRRGSYPYSDDGYDVSGRMTALSGKSNPTNIYKHGSKIWPGSR